MIYLNEDLLYQYLIQDVFPNYEFIRNRKVPGSNIQNRPDFRNDVLKFIVEFDGYQHYTQAKVIIADDMKDVEYNKLGYKIVRIPYFIQMSSNIVKLLFGVDVKLNQIYPHGFIDKNVIFPADFCEIGIRKFINDLERFSFVKCDIIRSLSDKISNGTNVDLILPPSLRYLLTNC